LRSNDHGGSRGGGGFRDRDDNRRPPPSDRGSAPPPAAGADDDESAAPKKGLVEYVRSRACVRALNDAVRRNDAGTYLESNYDESFDNFDNMNLKDDLLRGIYAYACVARVIVVTQICLF
jgi:hypothetical protein